MKKSQSSDYMTRLEKTLAIGEDENITARNNLQIEGTTKLNNGLEPIHIYSLPDGYQLFVLFEKEDEENNGFIGIGFIQSDDNSKDICLFSYSLTNGEISYLRTIESSGNRTKVSDSNLDINDFLISQTYAQEYYQDKLFTHNLTLTAGTNNYILMYNCSNNLNADSIQDLRALMKISLSSDSVILPVVNPTDLSTVGLQVTNSVCKIGPANVSAVSDKVTPL